MNYSEFLELKRRVEQQEKTIVQLMEIIAKTNKRLAEMQITKVS